MVFFLPPVHVLVCAINNRLFQNVRNLATWDDTRDAAARLVNLLGCVIPDYPARWATTLSTDLKLMRTLSGDQQSYPAPPLCVSVPAYAPAGPRELACDCVCFQLYELLLPYTSPLPSMIRLGNMFRYINCIPDPRYENYLGIRSR